MTVHRTAWGARSGAWEKNLCAALLDKPAVAPERRTAAPRGYPASSGTRVVDLQESRGSFVVLRRERAAAPGKEICAPTPGFRPWLLALSTRSRAGCHGRLFGRRRTGTTPQVARTDLSLAPAVLPPERTRRAGLLSARAARVPRQRPKPPRLPWGAPSQRSG